jgi:hypothetical protein
MKTQRFAGGFSFLFLFDLLRPNLRNGGPGEAFGVFHLVNRAQLVAIAIGRKKK